MNKKSILKSIITLLMIQVSIANTSCVGAEYDTQSDVCYSSTCEEGYTSYDYSGGEVRIGYNKNYNKNNVVSVIDLRDCSNPGMEIVNSYKIRDIETMREIIDIMLDYNKKNDITPSWNRTENSMIYEWILHNVFYDLGILVDHSGDVDFNNNELKIFK